MEPESISATKIGGFRVIRRLASGATTDVLLAHADGTDRIVALKVLLQQFRSDPAFEQTFVREAAAYGRLSHPAIVELYDFFSVDGQFVMVLEYVDGLPLHKLRAMLSIGGEKVEDGAALFIASRVFQALAAAHAARDPETGDLAPVIHRDINPSNVLVPWDANVKISDFGIAKAGGTKTDTKMGFVKGTYGYLAPEQVAGENVTIRADVYAGSLLLWELLARRKAIQRGTMSEVEVLKAMARPEFPSIDAVRPDLDPTLREAVRRGLEINPDERSITAEEMAGLLCSIVKGDEGRATLAQAIARVRPAPSDSQEDSGGFKSAETSAGRPTNGSVAGAVAYRSTAAVSAVADDRGIDTTEGSKPGPTVDSDAPTPPPPPPLKIEPVSVAASPVLPVTAEVAIVVESAPSSPSKGRAGPPKHDVALIVVLMSALIGVAVVAFYLWSEEGNLPPTVSPGAVVGPSGGAIATTAPGPVAPVKTSAAVEPAPSAASAAPSAVAALPAPAASAPLRVAMPAGSDTEAAAAGLGDIFTMLSAGGHRVFLDGRVIGHSPDVIRVRCGKHEIRVGGNGIPQTVDIPCGGSILVNPKWPAPSDDRPPP